MDYLIDSNVIIDYLENRMPQKSRNFITQALEKSFQISIITYVEVLGFDEEDEKKWELLKAFFKMAKVYVINERIAEQTIKIRKQTKIKLPDAFIAGTALTNNLTLITRNIKDFEKIDKLKIINPYV